MAITYNQRAEGSHNASFSTQPYLRYFRAVVIDSRRIIEAQQTSANLSNSWAYIFYGKKFSNLRIRARLPFRRPTKDNESRRSDNTRPPTTNEIIALTNRAHRVADILFRLAQEGGSKENEPFVDLF
jgi:hypothetical protein